MAKKVASQLEPDAERAASPRVVSVKARANAQEIRATLDLLREQIALLDQSGKTSKQDISDAFQQIAQLEALVAGRQRSHNRGIPGVEPPRSPEPALTEVLSFVSLADEGANAKWIWLSQRGRVAWMSPSCQSLHGGDLDRPTIELFAPADRPRFEQSSRLALKGQAVLGQPFLLDSKHSGSIPVRLYLRSLASEKSSSEPLDSAPLLALAHPSSQVIDPVVADPMQGDFRQLAARWSHEIKQPLTAIAQYTRGCLGFLEQPDLDRDEMNHALHGVLEQTDRTAQILDRLRGLSERKPLQLTAIDLNALVQASLSRFAVSFQEQGVAVRSHLADHLPAVSADAVQIGQVLDNLLRNAMDALRDVPAPRRRLEIATRLDDSRLGNSKPSVESPSVEFALRDHGSGLSVDIVKRLFQPFSSTKPEGMGIGLSLCRAILSAHGGRLWAQSHADQGTTFFFALLPHNP